MEKIKFYVYRKEEGSVRNLTLKEAMYWFRKGSADDSIIESTKQYRALGIEDADGSIDLIKTEGQDDIVTLSRDYLQIPRFKNNKLISINVINILKSNFISDVQ